MEDNCLKDAGVICIFAASEEHLLCDIVNETCTLYYVCCLIRNVIRKDLFCLKYLGMWSKLELKFYVSFLHEVSHQYNVYI